MLTLLSSMGVTLSIDDFGTGYSSLASLRHLPIDAIKIDRSFVAGMLGDSSDLAIVCSVIDLARRLEIETVAEGIESDETKDRLAALGCDLGQGFGLARPDTEKITAWFGRRDTITDVGTPSRT